jgi:biotin synthase
MPLTMDSGLTTSLKEVPVSDQTALQILESGPDSLGTILAAASSVREEHFGNTVHLCSILNAKSGACDEDCRFCSQSTHQNTEVETFDLRSPAQIAAARDKAAKLPIDHFGVVTSGGALDDSDLANVEKAIIESGECAASWCASLGCLDKDQLLRLKRAGLKRFHHNLETAESFFPSICTTHTYAQRLATIRAVKEAGLELCCGGVLGMGESLEQRVELAMTLAREEINSIPLNFLVPVSGTAFENMEVMQPLEILKSIAMFRLVNPTAEIKVCAGRMHLRSLQSMIFLAGATGMLIGPLLTVVGGDVEDDLQMIKDLDLTISS